jgi:putative transposase
LAEKKIGDLDQKEKYLFVDVDDPDFSIRKQIELLGINRSSYYSKPALETTGNLAVMDQIDREYTRHPFYGSRRMAAWLNKEGYHVNRKRVQRLMRVMGLAGICPKKNLSQGDKKHKIYPYLLKGLAIAKPNQVWSTDITYVKIRGGFMYYRGDSLIALK